MNVINDHGFARFRPIGINRILIPLIFAICSSLTLAGFAVLLDTPYTGIRMSVCGDYGCVASVDQGSPAYGKLQPGDRIVDINELNLSPLVFNEDPDYIRLERDFHVFWKAARKLDESLTTGQSVEISLKREGALFNLSLVPVQFPLSRALSRTVPIYAVGWMFLIVSYLVYRKKKNEASTVFLLVGALVCIDWAAGTPFTVRDLMFHYLPFRILNVTDLISALFLIAGFLHLSLVFPKRLLPPKVHARVVATLYSIAALLIFLRFLNFFDNTYFTSYFAFTAVLITVVAVYLVQYFSEKSTVVRRQIKWVVLSVLLSSVIYSGLSAVPVMLGSQFVSVALSGLGFILIPVSFAFAITKYRLMEIENLLDNAVIYGFTILVLTAVETAFLSLVSPYLLVNGKGMPYFSVIAVLVIVFSYVPVRDVVRRLVERLFRRGKYVIEEELRHFTVELGLCDERSALEKFAAFTKKVIGTSGIAVLKKGAGTVSLHYADNDEARREGAAILPRAGELWAHVRGKGASVFGYDVLDKIVTRESSITPDFESALVVPFFADSADAASGYLAVLLKKCNETAYSVKDVTLLNAVSASIARVIESGELRKERDAIRKRFEEEKDLVMKELHDGLGNILTSIIVTAQAAERVYTGNDPAGQQMVRQIEEFSTEAVDFMRTGLTVLDNPQGDLAAIMESVKDRFAALFESSGAEFVFECSEEAGRARPGAMLVLNITRIIQEAFSNIIKHAGASQVRMKLDQSGQRLVMTISDDGKGFSVGAGAAGHGIKNMRKRVDAVNGEMEMVSAPGMGAELRFTFPFTRD